MPMQKNLVENPRDTVLRLRGVIVVTGLSRSTIYALIGRDEFPRPIKLTGKAVGWPESTVRAWLASRAEQSAA